MKWKSKTGALSPVCRPAEKLKTLGIWFRFLQCQDGLRDVQHRLEFTMETNMEKSMKYLIAVVTALSFAACSKSPPEQPAAEVNLQGVKDKKAAEAATQVLVERQKELTAAAEKYGKEEPKKK